MLWTYLVPCIPFLPSIVIERITRYRHSTLSTAVIIITGTPPICASHRRLAPSLHNLLKRNIGRAETCSDYQRKAPFRGPARPTVAPSC